jgi:hypothetical protein
MARIAITAEAYDAIACTLALGTVVVEPQPSENGERLIWIEERRLDKLNSIGRSGESYSEAIIRLAALWEGHWTQKTTLRKLAALLSPSAVLPSATVLCFRRRG